MLNIEKVTSDTNILCYIERWHCLLELCLKIKVFYFLYYVVTNEKKALF